MKEQSGQQHIHGEAAAGTRTQSMLHIHGYEECIILTALQQTHARERCKYLKFAKNIQQVGVPLQNSSLRGVHLSSPDTHIL